MVITRVGSDKINGPPTQGRARKGAAPLLPRARRVRVLTPGVAGTGCPQEEGMLSRGAAGPEHAGAAPSPQEEGSPCRHLEKIYCCSLKPV